MTTSRRFTDFHRANPHVFGKFRSVAIELRKGQPHRGSTGVAAIQMHNRFIGIELGPDHFEICKRRVAAAFDTFPLLNPKGDQ